MIFTPKRFYKDFPKEKRKKDTIFCLFLLRPLSFVVSSLFSLLHISANATSIISLAISFGGSVLLFINFFVKDVVLVYWSLACIFIWAILDCVDGNLARTVKKQKYGDFFDAIAGYIIPGFYFSLFGFNSCFFNDVVFGNNNPWISIIASTASISFITILLFKKKYTENSEQYGKNVSDQKDRNNLVIIVMSRMWSEFSFGGFLPLILLLSTIFNVMTLATLIYSCLFFALFCFGTLFLLFASISESKREDK